MKRMLAMMLTLLLMLSIHMGALAAEPNEIIWLDENGNVTTLEAAAVTICTPQYGQAQVIVPVKCFFETEEGTASFTIYPAAMNVTFKYYVAADKAGKLVGGYGVTEDGYPMLEALPVDWPLDVSFALETVPVVKHRSRTGRCLCGRYPRRQLSAYLEQRIALRQKRQPAERKIHNGEPCIQLPCGGEISKPVILKRRKALLLPFWRTYVYFSGFFDCIAPAQVL